jgi:hypothetical protein
LSRVLASHDGIGGITVTVLIEKFQRHQANGPVDPGDSKIVISNGACYSGDVAGVTFLALAAKNDSIVVNEVEPIDVIDKSIPIIVGAVGYFSGIRPDVLLQVLVTHVYSGIDYSNDDTTTSGTASARVPSLRSSDLEQSILKVREEVCVVRCYRGAKNVIGLGVQDVWLPAQRRDRSERIRWRNASEPQTFNEIRSAEALHIDSNQCSIVN